MRNQNREGNYRNHKRLRVRLFALGYFTLLLTFFSPSPDLKTPPLKPTPAVAEELDYRDIARDMAWRDYGWGKEQFKCLNILWGKESAWNPEADNPISTAFGIAQMLGEKSTNPVTQIRNGLRYIEHRYERPCAAWSFWLANRWY